MGLLRKLAEMVVEFPDKESSGESEASQDDVVAAIEKIRRDLEKNDQVEFAAQGDDSGEPQRDPTPASAPVVSAATAGGLVSAANRHIPMPTVLAIQEIYDQAKVPEAEISIYRVEEMLEDPEIADLSPEMRARMVKMTLKNLNVELSDILTDAGHRDKALEAYRNFLEEIIEGIADQIKLTNDEIQQEIDSFIQRHQVVIDKNNAKLKTLHDALADFRRSKEAEEQRLFDIAAPFIGQGENPVEIGS